MSTAIVTFGILIAIIGLAFLVALVAAYVVDWASHHAEMDER